MKNRNSKTKRAPLTFFGLPFASIALVSAAFAAIGWVAENIMRFIMVGTLDARFYVLPFISAYGCIPFAFHAFLRSPSDIRFFGKKLPIRNERAYKILTNIIAYISMLLFVFVVELAIGHLWDYLFDVQLWDYRWYPMHFTRYTSVPTTLVLGSIGFVLFKTAYKWLLGCFSRFSYTWIKVLATVLWILIALDTINMILYMAVMGEAPMLWSVKLRG